MFTPLLLVVVRVWVHNNSVAESADMLPLIRPAASAARTLAVRAASTRATAAAASASGSASAATASSSSRRQLLSSTDCPKATPVHEVNLRLSTLHLTASYLSGAALTDFREYNLPGSKTSRVPAKCPTTETTSRTDLVSDGLRQVSQVASRDARKRTFQLCAVQ